MAGNRGAYYATPSRAATDGSEPQDAAPLPVAMESAFRSLGRTPFSVRRSKVLQALPH